MSPRRRFIAGAVCPQCAALDRTLLEIDGERRERRCIACGHSEVLRDLDAPVPGGRFGSPGQSDTGAEVTAVRLLHDAGSAGTPERQPKH